KLTTTGGDLKNDRSKEEKEKHAYSLKENLLPDTVSGLMLAVQQVTQEVESKSR
ncbi:hypothetical protein U0070_022724, partial [Myodes glareolus]